MRGKKSENEKVELKNSTQTIELWNPQCVLCILRKYKRNETIRHFTSFDYRPCSSVQKSIQLQLQIVCVYSNTLQIKLIFEANFKWYFASAVPTVLAQHWSIESIKLKFSTSSIVLFRFSYLLELWKFQKKHWNYVIENICYDYYCYYRQITLKNC